uniref:Kinetochore localized astrin (SPAG5) binding protein n=1 Tax=Lepisosteus oculatus TaxID=7918 RepID=W5N4Q8_LEPOC
MGERENSRIPLYQEKKQYEATKSNDRPAESMKKTVAPKFEVPTSFNFAVKSEKVGAFKPQNPTVSKRKIPQNGVYKGPNTRLRVEAELRDKNQLLEASNLELYRNLSEAKENIAKLTQKYTGLEGESSELKKQLEKCMLFLETSNIDPVSGEKILETAKQNEEQRKEVLSLSRNLQNELEVFSQKASEHRLQMQEIKSKVRAQQEEIERRLKEKENFQTELQEMEKALDDAQQLLDV